ncbi:MAG: heme-binding beta-barrel domain-containing protein [Mariprofundaceae bacterium]
MSDESEIDFGPLSELIGVWKGDKGVDAAPEPDGLGNIPYHETITFTAVGDVTNAGSQTLSVITYHQVVQRKSDDEVFHDEIGYWMWDPKDATVMHSLMIPRAVCLLAGGTYGGEKDSEGRVVLEVAAGVDNKDWGIVQSPFMQEKARTTGFSHKITVGNGKLSYFETTVVDIYGKIFEHTDQNELIAQ